MYVVVYFKIVTFQSKEFQNIVYIIESFSNKAHLPQHTFTSSRILQKSCRAKRGIQKRIQCYGSHLKLGSPPLASIYGEQDIIEKLPSKARHSTKKDLMLWKLSQSRFISPSIHLRQVGYYKTIAKRSEAQGDGIYTLETTAIQVHLPQHPFTWSRIL